MPHSYAVTVATMTTNYSTSQNLSEQNSYRQRRQRRLLCRHALLLNELLVGAVGYVLLDMRVQTEEESSLSGWTTFPHQRNDDTIDYCVETGIEMIGPGFLHNDRHSMNKETARAFNMTRKEKLSLCASDVSFKNRSHDILLGKMLDIGKFPLVLCTLFRTVTE